MNLRFKIKKICKYTLAVFFISIFLGGQVLGQRIWKDELTIMGSDSLRMRALGRWDIWIHEGKDSIPIWLEIASSGRGILVGRIVGREGSERPISEIFYNKENGKYEFMIPPQWGEDYREYNFKYVGDKLEGEVGNANEVSKDRWEGQRAPELGRKENIIWGEPIDLLKGGAKNWVDVNDWQINHNSIIHEGTGLNLVSKAKFRNFKLHAEFRYSKGANSGIYLRGRYEVQIADSYGLHAESHNIGGIYGFIAPSDNMAKKAGEWQSYDLVLNGRFVNVTLNGIEVICNREIPGITGGALDCNEHLPGPIKLQGDERGRIEFRKLVIIPEE